MKILGYVDDLINWIFDLHMDIHKYSPWALLLVITVEIILFVYFWPFLNECRYLSEERL